MPLDIIIDFPAEAAAPVEDRRSERLVFRDPVEIIVARTVSEVVAALRRVEQAAARGQWCAGFVAYEAAPAFEPAMAVVAGGVMPLLMFGVYAAPTTDSVDSAWAHEGVSDGPPVEWVEQTAESEFLDAIEVIHNAIAAGETYQVNYTTRLRARFVGDAHALYERLRRAQGTGWHAFIDTDEHSIISASPELFFDRTGDRLITRPMKGTRPRGRWLEEDEEKRSELIASSKDRAENLMIVDLLRNDVGRIARTGSVSVPSLYEVERYPTVWQLTSRVEGTVSSDVGLTELFAALFPCGSVTGAPKINTMKWIASLENAPREVYCGALGVVRPGGDCTFSVPIRTLWVDKGSRIATYGTGSGVTADSDARAELAELRDKAAVLRDAPEMFALLETMRAQDGAVVRRDAHLARLRDSAAYFGFALDERAVGRALDEAARVTGSSARLRLRVMRDGSFILDPPVPLAADDTAIVTPSTTPRAVVLSRTHVDSRDPFLCHKTTNRHAYDTRLADARVAFGGIRTAAQEVFDVLLWNERGEITEFTIGNVVLEMTGAHGTELVTPARTSGLLAGTFRGELLAKGSIVERVVHVSELPASSRLWLINSVREWVEVSLGFTTGVKATYGENATTRAAVPRAPSEK